MLSNRPYLLRAFHEWILDSHCTPIIVIDANNPRCKIPKNFAEGGEIVFNIAPSAIRDLKMTNELVEFKASFSGVIHIISAPVNAILAVYAEENGEGIFFDAEEGDGSDADMMLQLRSVENKKLDKQTTAQMATSETVVKNKPTLTLVE